MFKREISFRTPKNIGKCFATLFRSLLIECDETVKVVGFSLEGSSSFLPGKNVIDSINLSQALSDLTIVPKIDSISYPTVVTVTFQKELRSKDLVNNDFDYLEDVSLIQVIDNEPRKISLVLDKNSGYFSSHSARRVIESLGVDTNKFTPISARHSDLRVATNVTQRFDGDVVTVGVQSELDCDQKIVNCLHKIQEIITGVSLT